MSSSMFIERSSPLSADSKNCTNASDSNLVVVYGKNGINFDDKGLENLIDEKKISSISVIRITSPTPSMEEEEDKEAKLEELVRRQELESANDNSEEDEEYRLSGETSSSDEEDESCQDFQDEQQDKQGLLEKNQDDSKLKGKKFRRRGRHTNIVRNKKSRRRRRERAKIVGLSFEEFYREQDANEIIKRALKLAGLGPDRKSKEDLEFQLLVIKNDHCYTPFTSPSQMRAKLEADKLELEKQNRKITSNQNIVSTGKQLFVRKKALQKSDILQKSSLGSSTKEKISMLGEAKSFHTTKEDERENESTERRPIDEDNPGSSREDDDSEYTEGNETDESDNDRDSDLDFDVNNPKGKRRKIRAAKLNKRLSSITKITQKPRRVLAQEENPDLGNKISHNTSAISRQKQVVMKNVQDAGRVTIRSTPTKIQALTNVVGTAMTSSTLNPLVPTSPSLQRKQNELKLQATAKLQASSPSTHKEIIIHRQIMPSPKTKGFTDLNTLLLDHNEKALPIATIANKAITTKCSATSPSPKHSTSKGFMPLVLDTASKNQLPAQISIQTHQSTSELEAEHDKQLDCLIDEMQKSNEILMPTNIPELVKMLESTEAALTPSMHLNSVASTPKMCENKEKINVEHIVQAPSSSSKIAGMDMTSTTMLPTTDDDDLPDDILQQVVDLIKDDKTLQEAVDVLGSGDSNDPLGNATNTANQNPPPLAPISQQANSKNILEDIPHSSKSIIQMSISNVTPVNRIIPLSPITPSRVTQQTVKTSPLVRKEPIQIIRGNGRVITLPPIEAPTTRAKRRAQIQPCTSTSTSTMNNSPSSSIFSSTVSEISLDSSTHSNSSLTSVCATNIVQEKKNVDNSTRRRSKENITIPASVSSPKIKRNSANKKPKKHQLGEGISDSGGEDDDDPNKLWCICRQPHNNRFMICCDSCEDWFHGTCVNITKAMGLEMEQKGIDWTCPKCVKKIEEKKQPKITEMLIRNPVPQLPETICLAHSDNLDGNTIVSKSIATGNTQQLTSPLSNEIKQTVVETPKTKIHSGQVINLNSIGGKQLIIQASNSVSGNSGPKKVFVATTQPIRTAPTLNSSSIRTITVVKQICRGKQQTQQQNIQFIKAISPSQSTNQGVKVASGAITSSETPTPCIVCKKIARSNSVFCSDDCIRKHAQTAWTDFISKSQTEVSSPASPLSKNPTDDKMKKKSKGLFEEELSMVDRKTKMERVTVFERKSGRTLSGNSAPTFANLKKWLQDNPTFEVVRPGSQSALDVEKKPNVRVQPSISPTTSKAITSPPPLKMLPLLSSFQQKSEIRSNSPKNVSIVQQKSNKNVTDFLKNSPLSANSRPSTPKQLQKYPQQVSIKVDKIQKSTEEGKSLKEKSSAAKRPTSTESGNKNTGNDGDIRHVVRHTLKEQLLQRIQEGQSSSQDSANESINAKDVPNMTPEEIEEFTKATELEMYNYFNRDTGAKYKAKYRSLLFNIKDRKNYTLYAKICGKLIEPKQLIRMSPEEMASQELAQWREQEKKHQLEMIEKSELDSLACAKNYVLKTHKGEEVIEGKSSEFSNVDITIRAEDLEPIVKKSNYLEAMPTFKNQTNYSEMEINSHMSETITNSEKLSSEEKSKSFNSHIKERDKEKDRHREREREREKRHKSKDRHRDKSRSHKRSRSPSRSRSGERNDKRHKSCHREEKHAREKDRMKERSEQQNDISEKRTYSEKKTVVAPKPRESRSVKRQTNEQKSNSIDTYNLVDKILESTKTVEEAANLTSSKNKEADINRKTNVVSLPTSSISSTTSSSGSDASCVVDIPALTSYVESDQEPSSTVSIPTPPHDPYARFLSLDSPLFESSDNSFNNTTLWTGNINMVDVTSFSLSIQPVLGNCVNLSKLLSKELDVVGRIGAETVWDYISKIKKSPNKEIVIVRLLPACETETSAYKLLYEYLDNRSRLGVIKSVSPFIKDFYIYPLGARKLLPIVLRPSESVEFFDDPCRPDILMGIIVRVVKRYNIVAQQPAATIADPMNKFISRANDGDSNTPPGSPKLKKRRQSVVPKDIDVDAIIKAPIISKTNKVVPAVVSTLKDSEEPYSPGGSSDDDLPLPTIKSASSNQMQNREEELKRKMEEINRQIAAQEMEIAGLLTGESRKFGNSTGTTSKVLANIAIPSNLSQILASIKPTASAHEGQPVVPPPPPLIGSIMKTAPLLNSVEDEYNPADPIEPSYGQKITTHTPSTSRLAKLSEAELLSMVPDDVVLLSKPPVARHEEPPPPGV
ncbi:death-inducer obliterator 1 [Stomoxys calcitrans]|uniref:death-inducer obliterator 1 n=1 Tax=Stomoxys calcitrans TaxID=35570 RepID=UPI0027E2E8F4|nr:death-inducer obliterator 1 [Stomoxys calcitrans]XP_013107133.2 death-inducer obliterator 1 [Stomoxys calcitrans]XP_013107135.2 death-inducer obliterator 1 [Stomoxys calcitrans]